MALILFIFQKAPDSVFETGNIAQFAFPQYQHSPAVLGKLFLVFKIACPIFLQLWSPKIQAGFGQSGQPATGVEMAVPETAVYEYDLATRGKNQIGLAGQIPAMEAIAVIHAMHQAADFHFRLGILSVDSAHPLAPGGGRQRIGSAESFSGPGRIGKIFGQDTLIHRRRANSSSFALASTAFTHPSFAF
jgi:hypothetical protein